MAACSTPSTGDAPRAQAASPNAPPKTPPRLCSTRISDKGSKQELREIVDTAFAKHDLRIIAAIGAATTIIIAAMALLKLFG